MHGCPTMSLRLGPYTIAMLPSSIRRSMAALLGFPAARKDTDISLLISVRATHFLACNRRIQCQCIAITYLAWVHK